jgi:hypothetical protein
MLTYGWKVAASSNPIALRDHLWPYLHFSDSNIDELKVIGPAVDEKFSVSESRPHGPF